MAIEALYACVVLHGQNIGSRDAGKNEHSDEVGMEGGAYVTNVENVLFDVVMGVGDNAN